MPSIPPSGPASAGSRADDVGDQIGRLVAAFLRQGPPPEGCDPRLVRRVKAVIDSLDDARAKL